MLAKSAAQGLHKIIACRSSCTRARVYVHMHAVHLNHDLRQILYYNAQGAIWKVQYRASGTLLEQQAEH